MLPKSNISLLSIFGDFGRRRLSSKSEDKDGKIFSKFSAVALAIIRVKSELIKLALLQCYSSFYAVKIQNKDTKGESTGTAIWMDKVKSTYINEKKVISQMNFFYKTSWYKLLKVWLNNLSLSILSTREKNNMQETSLKKLKRHGRTIT